MPGFVRLHIDMHCPALPKGTDRHLVPGAARVSRRGEGAEEAAVKKSARYREQDYAFGQQMLTLRTALGLTQGELAERLGLSLRTVSGWEAGSSYPTTRHLQELIVLGVRASAFPIGREAEEIRAL